jgi:cell division protein FtsW
VPVTGVTLPLVSMGGSSFLFTCAAIGIILSVARNVEQLEGNTSTGINNIESNNTIQKVVNPAIA